MKLSGGLYARVRTREGVHYVESEAGALHVLSDAPWRGGERTGETVDAQSFLAPSEPSKVVCVGRNYAAHAKELGNEVPKFPLLFLKPPSALIGHAAFIELPSASERVEHEGELAVIMGARLRDGSEEDAKNAIFGFTSANDVTARDLQRADVQFTRGKGFDTFCPLGPAIRRDLDVKALQLQVHVNEELRQDGNTNAMMWNPFALVSTVSQIMTLEAGDVVLTGTPAGVGPLKEGDTVVVNIEGLPPLTNSVRRR